MDGSAGLSNSLRQLQLPLSQDDHVTDHSTILNTSLYPSHGSASSSESEDFYDEDGSEPIGGYDNKQREANFWHERARELGDKLDDLGDELDELRLEHRQCTWTARKGMLAGLLIGIAAGISAMQLSLKLRR